MLSSRRFLLSRVATSHPLAGAGRSWNHFSRRAPYPPICYVRSRKQRSRGNLSIVSAPEWVCACRIVAGWVLLRWAMLLALASWYGLPGCGASLALPCVPPHPHEQPGSVCPWLDPLCCQSRFPRGGLAGVTALLTMSAPSRDLAARPNPATAQPLRVSSRLMPTALATCRRHPRALPPAFGPRWLSRRDSSNCRRIKTGT